MNKAFNIRNIDGVKNFAKHLTFVENLNFHPDEDFCSYINIETKNPTYTQAEIDIRNSTITKCFEICEKEGVDIYEIMSEHL